MHMALLKRKHSFWSAEILPNLRKAGYAAPTPFQQAVIPLIMKGRDVAAEAEEGTGKTAAFILPMLLSLPKNEPGIKAVVLTKTPDASRKILNACRKFFPGRELSFLTLGIQQDSRKSERFPADTPDVLIGTPERVIDHIRRGSLQFNSLKSVVIDADKRGQRAGFDEDIHFIFSKFPHRTQTLLFSPLLADGDPLFSVLNRPQVLSRDGWMRAAGGAICPRIFIPATDAQKSGRLADLYYARRMKTLLVLASQAVTVKQIAAGLKKHHLEALTLVDTQTQPARARAINAFNTGRPPVLVATYNAVSKRALTTVTHIIQFDPPPGGTYDPQSTALRSIISLGTEKDYITMQERSQVKIEKEGFPHEDEVLAGMIANILGKIKQEEDPEDLNRFRRLIKKNVPLSMRSYFSAYLLKSKTAGKAPGKPGKKEFSKLFVSIGRNRHLYPRDFISLFTSELGISRAQLGEIKVLDNYSFIDIRSQYAEKAIRRLSGKEVKGKQIVVNHARKKVEK
jgi:ATP-dependent RNA helicase DeaD